MGMNEIIELQDGSLKARLNTHRWQLYSLELDGAEFMWGGGKPEELKTEEEKQGWPNSEILMFPNVGRATGDELTIGGRKFPMAQHGLARHLDAEIYGRTDNRVSFSQKYRANTRIETAKGPCVFPFSFGLYREYTLEGGILTHFIKISNDSHELLPYSVGWHPALRILSEGSYVEAGSTRYSLEKIKEESKTGALLLENTSQVKYISRLGSVKVHSSSGLDHTQVWSPEGQNLVCPEPISAFSLSRANYDGEFRWAPGYRFIEPGDLATFFVYLEPEISRNHF